MPELVACPVCDCRILVAEVLWGRRVRCMNCEQTFVAGELAPVEEPTTYLLVPEETVDEPTPVAGRGPEATRHRLPLCPRCHRPVRWEDRCCAHCGHLFEPLDGQDRATWQVRRDTLPHRGELIGRLGRYALFGGGITLCTGGLAVLVALGCGIPAWWMAQQDLAGMDANRIDPAGRAATEAGSCAAVGGIILGLVCVAFWILAIIVFK